MLTLQRKIGSSKQAIVTSLQCLVCCCHYVTDDLLTMLYPWLNAHASKPKPANTTAKTEGEGNVGKEGEGERGTGEKKKKKKKPKIQHSDAARVLSLRVRRLLHQVSDVLMY